MTDIATLNDTFRKTVSGGRVMLTAGINALPADEVAQILSRVRSFDDFTEDNDPYGEHETSLSFAREKRPQQRLVVRASRNAKRSVAAQFGSFDYKGNTIFCKIDYYDRNLQYLSEDPADVSKTIRIMTVMLASDY